MPKRKNNLRVCLITAALIFFSLECPLLVGSQITAVAREKFQDYTYYLYVFTRKNRKMTEHTLIFHPCSFTISFSQRRIEHRLAMLWNSERLQAPQTSRRVHHRVVSEPTLMKQDWNHVTKLTDKKHVIGLTKCNAVKGQGNKYYRTADEKCHCCWTLVFAGSLKIPFRHNKCIFSFSLIEKSTVSNTYP